MEAIAEVLADVAAGKGTVPDGESASPVATEGP
jgi:hypothetical protein